MKTLLVPFGFVALQLSAGVANAATPDAPAFLEKQSAETCMIKKVIEHFKTKQDLNVHGSAVTFNFNGEKDISSQLKRSRFDDQTVSTKNSGYTVTIRRFDSGLSGDQIDFIFGTESCDATRILVSCNTSKAMALYAPLRLVDGKCPEAAPVAKGWKAKPKPAVVPCPIAQEFCAVLKGENAQ